MSTATVRLNDRVAIAMDAVRPSAHTTQGVLLTLEGRTPGDTFNCAVIPLERVPEVIANLELVARIAAGPA